MVPPSKIPCGWSGSITDFLLLPKAYWVTALQEHHHRCTNSSADQGQLLAWDLEYDLLAKELKQLVQVRPDTGSYTIIFEQGSPREQGRNPAVIILGTSAYVLKFEDDAQILHAYVDRVAAYADDLKQRHAGSPAASVVPMLVLNKAKELIKREEDVIVFSPDRLAAVFTVEAEIETGTLIDPAAWINAR
jgi:hypothetical protein